MSSIEPGTQSTAWLGLGSNVGDGRKQIARALALLESSFQTSILRVSSCYLTAPWGVEDQQDFTNAVAEVSVDTGPRKLLGQLQGVEQSMGRQSHGQRWGPRCIDLDLLLMDQNIYFLPGLTIPHPRMHQRAFVLIPLYELEPDLQIPSRGTVRSCLARLGYDLSGNSLEDQPGVQKLRDENSSRN